MSTTPRPGSGMGVRAGLSLARTHLRSGSSARCQHATAWVSASTAMGRDVSSEFVLFFRKGQYLPFIAANPYRPVLPNRPFRPWDGRRHKGRVDALPFILAAVAASRHAAMHVVADHGPGQANQSPQVVKSVVRQAERLTTLPGPFARNPYSLWA